MIAVSETEWQDGLYNESDNQFRWNEYRAQAPAKLKRIEGIPNQNWNVDESTARALSTYYCVNGGTNKNNNNNEQ